MYRLMIQLRNRTRWLAVAAALCAAVGCTVGDSPPAYDDEEPDRIQRDPYYDSRYGDGYREPAPAPAPEPEPRPWEGSRLRAEGRGQDFSFKATRDGIVYVVDSRDRRLLYTGQLDEGEEITVSPLRNVIEIDGRRAKRVDIENRHLIRIFFERD